MSDENRDEIASVPGNNCGLRRAVMGNTQASPTSCLIGGCSDLPLLPVTDFHKAMLLCKHNLYLPLETRLCPHHMDVEDWGNIMNEISTEGTFGMEHSNDIVQTFKRILQIVQLTVSSALE